MTVRAESGDEFELWHLAVQAEREDAIPRQPPPPRPGPEEMYPIEGGFGDPILKETRWGRRFRIALRCDEDPRWRWAFREDYAEAVEAFDPPARGDDR